VIEKREKSPQGFWLNVLDKKKDRGKHRKIKSVKGVREKLTLRLRTSGLVVACNNISQIVCKLNSNSPKVEQTWQQ
jgi:hypothetical protein